MDFSYNPELEEEAASAPAVGPLNSLEVLDKQVSQPVESQEKQLNFSNKNDQIKAFFTYVSFKTLYLYF